MWELGQREKQEDSIFPPIGENKEQDRLFIVCDGMGGHSAGEVASKTVCDSISSYIMQNVAEQEGEFTDDDFKNALEYAYNELDAKDNGAEKKMGTTLTFLKLHDKGATIAHIGDSRVYHVRPGKEIEDTKILFQTYDHSLVNDLVKIGEMTPEEAKTSRQKNIITRAMQPNLEHRHRADIYHTYDIKPGDYFMLCTDGVIEQMEDDNIKFIFSEKGGDDQNKLRMLIELTKENRDNHSAEIVHITDVIDPLPIQELGPVAEIEQISNCEDKEDSVMENVEEQESISKPVKHGNKEEGSLRKMLNSIFINYKISSVAIIAVMLIAITVLLLRTLIHTIKEENVSNIIEQYENLINTGDKFLKTKNYDDAIVQYEMAKDLEKKYAGTEYAERFKKNAEDKSELARLAKVNYDRMQSDKQKYLSLVKTGDDLLSQKNYVESIETYELAKVYEEKYSSTEYSKEFNKNAAVKIYEAEQSMYTELIQSENNRQESVNAEQENVIQDEQTIVEESENATLSQNGVMVAQVTEMLSQETNRTDETVPVADAEETSETEVEDGNSIDIGLSVKWARSNMPDYHKEFESESVDGWRLPTEDELMELIDKCTWTWNDNGYNIVGPNGRSIFLPADGCYVDGSVQGGGSDGYYMTSNKDKEFYFNADEKKLIDKEDGYVGLSVRLVCE